MLPALVTEIVLLVESLSTITPPIVVAVAATKETVLAVLPSNVAFAAPNVSPAPADNALATLVACPTLRLL